MHSSTATSESCVATHSVAQSGRPCGLELRAVQREDGPAVHALLRSALPGLPSDPDRWLARWTWQCWQNPFRESVPPGWVLIDERQIVGHLGAVCVPLWAPGARRTGMIGTDYVVAPAAVSRGGVFAGLQLAQAFFAAAEDRVPIATTANELTGAVFARFGCRAVSWTRELWRADTGLRGQVRSCVGVRSRPARRLLTGLPGRVVLPLLARAHGFLRRLPSVPLPGGMRLSSERPDGLCGSLAGLAGGPGEPAALAIGGCTAAQPLLDRCEQYFRWRYTSHPERASVEVLCVRDGSDRLVAAAVVFHDHRQDGPVTWVEEVIGPGGPDLLRTLYCAALRAAAAAGAKRLLTTGGHPAMRSLFWELGFESRSRTAPALVIRPPAVDQPEWDPDSVEFWHALMF
jgi:hypothetical protein